MALRNEISEGYKKLFELEKELNYKILTQGEPSEVTLHSFSDLEGYLYGNLTLLKDANQIVGQAILIHQGNTRSIYGDEYIIVGTQIEGEQPWTKDLKAIGDKEFLILGNGLKGLTAGNLYEETFRILLEEHGIYLSPLVDRETSGQIKATENDFRKIANHIWQILR